MAVEQLAAYIGSSFNRKRATFMKKMIDEVALAEGLRSTMLANGVKPETVAAHVLSILHGIHEDDRLVAIPIADLMDRGVVRQKATIGLIEGGRPLFPPRALSMIFGSDSAGKSWMMLAIAVQEMQLGHNVMLIDYESNGNSQPLTERFLMLGVPSALLREHLTVFAIEGGLRPAHTDQWFNLIRDKKMTLVIVDSYGVMLARSGLDENRDADVANMNAICLGRLAAAGAAVVIVDHTTKAGSLESSAGSKRKRASIDGAAYAMSVETDDVNHQFTAYESGHTNIICVKSRLGTYRRGELVGVMEVKPGRYIDPDDANMVVEEPIDIRLVSPSIHEGEAIDGMVPVLQVVDADDMILNILTNAGQPCRTRFIQSELEARHVKLSQKAIEERMQMLRDASLAVYDAPAGWTTLTQFVSR